MTLPTLKTMWRTRVDWILRFGDVLDELDALGMPRAHLDLGAAHATWGPLGAPRHSHRAANVSSAGLPTYRPDGTLDHRSARHAQTFVFWVGDPPPPPGAPKRSQYQSDPYRVRVGTPAELKAVAPEFMRRTLELLRILDKRGDLT